MKQLYEAEAALELATDHPPGVRFPLVWSAVLVIAAAAVAWGLIIVVGEMVR